MKWLTKTAYAAALAACFGIRIAHAGEGVIQGDLTVVSNLTIQGNVSIGSDNDKIYFGGYGGYASYEGCNYDYIEIKEMQPYQKVITDWRRI